MNICNICTCQINKKPWLTYRYNDNHLHICSYKCSKINGSVGIENIINKEDFNFWAVPITDIRYYQNINLVDRDEYEKMDEIDKLKYDMENEIIIDSDLINDINYNEISSDEDYDTYSEESSLYYDSD